MLNDGVDLKRLLHSFISHLTSYFGKQTQTHSLYEEYSKNSNNPWLISGALDGGAQSKFSPL